LIAAGAHFSAPAALAAYADCFRLLAFITLAMIPSIFFFRIARRQNATTVDASPAKSPGAEVSGAWRRGAGDR
jgi:hypothetical protein